ncbi:MAG: magnesium transporter [Candidatus Woesearchaeota archaeon]
MAHSDFREISAGQLLSITGGILAGVLLAYLKEDLLVIPGLLILIPGFLEMRGSISGSLSSRLSSALHMGHIKPRIRGSGSAFLMQNVLAAFSLVLLISLVLGLVSLLATYIYFDVIYFRIVAIALAGGIISNIVMIPSTVSMGFLLFRKGYDPDNMMGPYVTTTGDLISMLSLFIAVMVIA